MPRPIPADLKPRLAAGALDLAVPWGTVLLCMLLDWYGLTLSLTLASSIYILIRDLLPGGSLGKRLTGLRVVDSETGRHPEAYQLLLRNVILAIPVVGFLVLPVEVALLIRGDRDGRLGDRLADTLVTSAKKP